MAPTKHRVIALLDVDCFELQVRGKEEGIPSDVLLQEPAYTELISQDFITCVNQPAKDIGIKRGPKRNSDNRSYSRCNVLTISEKYGKPDNLPLKIACDDIFDCIVSTLRRYARYFSFSKNFYYEPIVEKSNFDEFYIDLTHLVHQKMDDQLNLEYFTRMDGKREFKIDLEHDTWDMFDLKYNPLAEKIFMLETLKNPQLFALLQGAEIIAEVLDAIREKLGYVISAGVSGNKLLAKLACHRSKPNGLAILPTNGLPRVHQEMHFTKIPGLGGTSGENIQHRFKYIRTIADFMEAFYCKQLWNWISLECSPNEFYNKCNGLDNTPVVLTNALSKITCGKSLNTRSWNQSLTKRDFFKNLRNRFREMRNNILYDYDKRCRVPQTLKLEIYKHPKQGCLNRQLIFRREVKFDRFNLENLIRWRMYERTKKKLREWQPILGMFKSMIHENKPFLYLKNGSHIYSSVCRINLIAEF